MIGGTKDSCREHGGAVSGILPCKDKSNSARDQIRMVRDRRTTRVLPWVKKQVQPRGGTFTKGVLESVVEQVNRVKGTNAILDCYIAKAKL